MEYERCGLCGKAEKLSKTHIPPRAAGNQGLARRLVEFLDPHGSSFLQLTKIGTGGGAYGRWLCVDCNQRTGRWDEEYARWSRSLALQVQEAGLQPGRQLPMFLPDVAPGSVVRAMWAWMFALDPTLRADKPDLAASILSGDPVDPPADLRLVLGTTTSLGIWVSGQVGGYAVRTAIGRISGHTTRSGINVPGAEIVDVPRVAISSPPFVVLLAGVNHELHAPYFDTAEWLRDRAGARRDVSLLLPVVRSLEGLRDLALVTYEELAG